MSTPPGHSAGPPRGPLFWLSALGGWAIIAWGIRGALHHHIDTRPTQLARFFIDGALIHDLLFVPVVLGLGVVVARLVPGRWRAPVQTALIISGCAALLAWPEIRGYGRASHNPSSLPHDYSANLLIVVGAVVVATAAVTLVQRRRRSQAGTVDPG